MSPTEIIWTGNQSAIVKWRAGTSDTQLPRTFPICYLVGAKPPRYPLPAIRTFDDAAAEIERLRAALANAVPHLMHGGDAWTIARAALGK